MYFSFALFGRTLSENATFIDEFRVFVKKRPLKRHVAMEVNFCTLDFAGKYAGFWGETGVKVHKYIARCRFKGQIDFKSLPPKGFCTLRVVYVYFACVLSRKSCFRSKNLKKTSQNVLCSDFF